LVSLLVISTTLAQGAFQITSLQQQNANLTRQEQTLNNAVAQAANPAVIAKEAQQFGMRQDPNLNFFDLKSGKIISGKVSKSDAEINVPGYTP
jgi:cell division protein FtsB